MQLGIGAIPDAVLLFLTDKKDLGIHTEMFSDGVVDLVRAGIVTGNRKTLHKGKLVATFLMGSKKLYDFIDHNPDVEMYPVDYVNDPRVIAQNDNMVSINSCIEVDLMGQVAAETIGLKQFSGTGGQVDYVRGAAWSKNGKVDHRHPLDRRIGKSFSYRSVLGTGCCGNDFSQRSGLRRYGIRSRQTERQNHETARQSTDRDCPSDFRETLREEYHRRFRD